MATTSDSPAVVFLADAESDQRSAHTSTDERTTASQNLSNDHLLADEGKNPLSSVRTVDAEKTAAAVNPDIVSWDGPDDPGNPVNFSGAIKFVNVGIVSALTFITPLASSMFAPGVPQLMEEFHSSNESLAGFVVSVYVLGFAVGPLILAPASELLGRVVIYHVCNIGFTVFTVACAVSSDLGMLVAFRFFQGCFGSAPITNGGFFTFPLGVTLPVLSY